MQMLQHYKQQKEELEREIEGSLSIKLQQKMYEIDFDAY